MNVARRILAVCVVSGWGLTACLAPRHASVEVGPAQVLKVVSSEGRFPNGLRVIVETVGESEIAGVALAVDAGSAKDPPKQDGLAHVVEHDVFEAHVGDTPSVELRLNQLAAQWNAETSHDVVVYHAFAPKRAFTGLLQLFAEIAKDPLANVDSAAFEHERQVVEAERGLRTSHVQGQVGALLYDAIFPPGHPYARPVGGSRESVAALDLAMARAFAAANYQPARMTLYVSAPKSLDPFTLVSAAFGPSAGGALVASPAVIRDQLSPGLALKAPGTLATHEAAVAAPELWLAWPLPAGTVDERARATSLSRLADALIAPSFTSHRAVAHASCELIDQVLSNVLGCQLVLNDTSDIDGVIARTLAELREGFGHAKTNHGWSWSVQREAAISATLDLEALQNRAPAAAAQAETYGNPFLDQEVLGKLAELDLSQVSSLGYELADRKRAFALLIQPISGASGAGSGQESRDQRAIGAVGDAPDSAQTLALVRRERPREVTQFVLNNGLTVLAERRRGTPFATAILGFRGSSEWARDPALAEAVRLSESWRVQTPPSQAGLSLRWYENQDDRRFVARAVAPDIDAALKALQHERYPHFEWPSLRFRRLLPALTRAENGYDARADREGRAALFGDHPYAAFTPAARADSVSSQAVERFFLSARRPDNAALVIVADAEPDAIRAAAEANFGSWPTPKSAKISAPPAIALDTTHAPTLLVVDKPSPQVELRFSCLVEQGKGSARVAEKLLAAVLTDRARFALRQQTGIAYFASGKLLPLAAGADELSVTTSVDVSHVRQALRFLKTLAELGPGDVSDASWAWRRFQALESSAFEDQTTFATASSLLEGWLQGRAPSDADREPELIAALTQSDLAAPLATCGQHAVILALGNRATIESAGHR